MKVTLRKIRLNSGGYDSGGNYWGIGAPLYVAMTDEPDEQSYYFRASNRQHAKKIVRTNWKSTGRPLEGATFYN